MNRGWLECLVCGGRHAIEPKWTGRGQCDSAGKAAALEIRYDYASIQPFASDERHPVGPGNI